MQITPLKDDSLPRYVNHKVSEQREAEAQQWRCVLCMMMSGKPLKKRWLCGYHQRYVGEGEWAVSRGCAHHLVMKEHGSLGKYKLCHTSPESLGHGRCVVENWFSLQDPWFIAVKAMASLTGKEHNKKRCFIIKILSHELFHESSCRWIYAFFLIL